MKSASFFLFLLISGCTSTRPGTPFAQDPRGTLATLVVTGTPELHPDDPNLFIEVKSKIDWPSFEVAFDSSDYAYTLGQDGRGKRTRNNSFKQSFDLRLDKDENLERLIYYSNFRGDILFICESSIGDGGAGFIARLDGRTLRLKWKRHIPAFNIGQGLLHDDSAFVTAIGFVGRVNLESGEYMWRHDDLYGPKDNAFNSFEAPEITNGVVRFVETESYHRKTLANLEVDIATGKIIKTER